MKSRFSSRKLAIRLATTEDADLLLAWRNDPAVREASRNRDEVGPEEHRSWLDAVLADPARDLLVAELDDRPVGQVRFDRDEAGRYEISVSLAPEARGGGHGAELIAAGLRWLEERDDAPVVDAFVRPGNEASLRSFERNGFRRKDGDGELLRLVREPPAP